ncbi:uncharacterized protein BDW43DRAFT_269422 [Aspergillus alliaceus]|uniref:uncharacterized protein n=1 Tax=Petromyces alliaceus TaxID=209559 RepID=UPI0012A3F735|nr:uncharacterized protein BDW43DRAFT_269422 [Aspergillus alliaceus]KAB8235681.1 hypothetical protein BDW43DRAFT_269422 [Aspergillus alliaceus]
MRLSPLSAAATLWFATYAAASSTGPGISDITGRHTSRAPRPIVSGHEVHLPCAGSSICGKGTAQERRPDDYIALTFATINDTLKVNDNTILPAPLPAPLPPQLTAIKHSGSDPETLTLRYGMNILPVQRFRSGAIANLFRVDLMLFDQTTQPAEGTNLISIGLSQDPHSNLRITMITINPAPPNSKCDEKCDGDKTQRPGRPRSKNSISEIKHQIDRVGRMFYGSFTTPKARACKSHRAHQYSCQLHSHRQKSMLIVDFMRLIYPAILPFLLGVMAGGITCIIGVMVSKSVTYWSSRRERGGSDGEIENGPEVLVEKRGLVVEG